MEHQFFSCSNKIIKISKIIKNHIFYKQVPNIEIYKFSRTPEGYYDGNNNAETETINLLNFDLVDGEEEKKLTIKQFNKMFQPLNLYKLKSKKEGTPINFCDKTQLTAYENIQFINNNKIYYHTSLHYLFTEDELVFSSKKDVDLYVLLFKYDCYLKAVEYTKNLMANSSEKYKDTQTKILNFETKKQQETKIILKKYLNDNPELDIYKIINLMNTNYLYCRTFKEEQIINDIITN